MTTINTGSGSLYPNNSLLNEQLNPENPVTLPIQLSGNKEAKIELWDNAHVDLTRLGNLSVNGETIYSKNSPIQTDETEQTNYVFNKIEEKLSSTSLAMKAAHLLEQNLGGGVLKQVARVKGITSGNDDNLHSTHALTAKQTANVLTAKSGKFKLIHEELIQKTDMEDGDKQSFFKIKTIVTGFLSALEQGNGKEMSIEVAYTKEHANKVSAQKDNYWGTKAGGLFNTESYIFP